MANTPTSLRLRVADDVTLAADAHGDPDGRPVVLLHGGGQTRHAWHHTAEQLAAAGNHVLNVDLRGHGDSDWSPDGDYTFHRFAADVSAVARQCARPPALVGASLGGIASLLAAGEAPADDAVATALVLVDVAPRTEQRGVDRIRAFMRQGLSGFDSLEEAADAIASYNPHRPRPASLSGLTKNLRRRDDGRWYWHWDPAFMVPDEPDTGSPIDGMPQRRGIPQDDLEAAARRITVPTLLVRGGASDLLSEEGARHLLDLIPHARLVNVAGAGHMVAGDRNDNFNTAVTEFLAAG
jgi:pimeloyl-ACP methyl ester carboxylesterase